MVSLLIANWFVDVAHTTFDFDHTFLSNVISEAIQTSFQNAIRILPFSLFIATITNFFEKPILFDTTGKFSPFYLAFVFIINMFTMFIYRNNQIQLSEQGIISAFILFVIVISIFKVNQPSVDTTNASNSLDRFITFCLNFFLNFNVKILYILMPFILFFAIAFFLITDATTERVLQAAAVFTVSILLIVLIAIIHGAVKKHQRKSRSGKNAATNLSSFMSTANQAFTTVANPVVLKPFLKTSLYLAFYSVPLAAYIYLTSNNFDLFKQKYLGTFNKQFLEIMTASYVVTSVLHKFISIKQQQVDKFVSLQIVLALLVSNISNTARIDL